MVAAPYSALSAQDSSFGEDWCLHWLLRTRNPDGGWGYRPGAVSAVEPTCWALLALLRRPLLDSRPSSHAWLPDIEPCQLAAEWVRRVQLRDGSWPAFAGQARGCWTTALACQALLGEKQSLDSVVRGVRWLCDAWPAEWGLWQRVRYQLRLEQNVTRQNPALRGWSWTPGTASWVEPTAHVLRLLKSLPQELLPRSAGKRRRLAEAMLYDRMCPGGGWNAGNPMIYNVAGVPRVGPTAWVLLALHDQRERPEVKSSVNWLASVYGDIQSPGSLALAQLALRAHGNAVSSPEAALQTRFLVNECLQNVAVVAWVALALAAN